MTLAERARKLREISPLMKDRDKLETRDVIGRELTIMMADIVGEGTSDEYGVVVFAEEPQYFLFCGMVLTSLLKDLKASFEAEGKDLTTELAATVVMEEDGSYSPRDGALRIKMKTRRGKPGRHDYTNVEVL